MSWIITGSFAQPDEPEALAYIAAVEAADGQALEDDVKFAYNSFIKGCKTDGIWNAIKACCILAGARTLSGALVPLKGTAPTNNNFVSGDYNRETGLVGDGSTKYLNSNRAGNADPQDNRHISVNTSSLPSANLMTYIGSRGASFVGSTVLLRELDSSRAVLSITSTPADKAQSTGFLGGVRATSLTIAIRTGGSTTGVGDASSALASENYLVFARNRSGIIQDFSDARLSFYSIGESLDLAALDSRVTTLMTDIGAAIP